MARSRKLLTQMMGQKKNLFNDNRSQLRIKITLLVTCHEMCLVVAIYSDNACAYLESFVFLMMHLGNASGIRPCAFLEHKYGSIQQNWLFRMEKILNVLIGCFIRLKVI